MNFSGGLLNNVPGVLRSELDTKRCHVSVSTTASSLIVALTDSIVSLEGRSNIRPILLEFGWLVIISPVLVAVLLERRTTCPHSAIHEVGYIRSPVHLGLPTAYIFPSIQRNEAHRECERGFFLRKTIAHSLAQ